MTAPATSHEERLVGMVRAVADIHDRNFAVRPDWAHQSPAHLLLALGRTFAPAPRLRSPIGMPYGDCYRNAARYASRTPGLTYVEGVALVLIGSGRMIHLAHAWVVEPDGAVLDPTWDEPGLAYFGVPISDPALWPLDGNGLLDDFGKTLPLLRGGLPAGAVGDVGRRPARS